MSAPPRGRWMAVCCTSNSATSIINDFLETTYAQSEPNKFLVVITSLPEKYTEITEAGSVSSSFATPFASQTPSECSRMVRQMVADTNSDINYEYMVVLDERSVKDKTAIVMASDEGKDAGEIESVRAEWGIVNMMVGAAMAKGLFSEYVEMAEKAEDGVVRF